MILNLRFAGHTMFMRKQRIYQSFHNDFRLSVDVQGHTNASNLSEISKIKQSFILWQKLKYCESISLKPIELNFECQNDLSTQCKLYN